MNEPAIIQSGPVKLGPDEVEQLLALDGAGTTWPGDTLSHADANDLVRKGLAARLDGWFVVTKEGSSWLRRAGLVAQR